MLPKNLVWSIGVILLLISPLQAWTTVGTGIEYQKYDISGPNDVFVARMLRSETSAFIESSIGQGKTVSGTETVPSQASRYDDAIGYWGQTWGTRNDVVVAINGSYYNTSTGEPYSGVIHSGSYDKRYDNVSGQSGFVWDLNRNANVGECVTHVASKQFVTYATSNTQQFQGINRTRGDNELIIYTPQYDTDTNTDNTGSEVVVQMSTPFLIKPTPNMVTGVVIQIRQNAGSTPLPFDCIVLSAKGTAATTLLANVQVNDTIGVSQEIASYETNCSTSRSLDWTKAYAGVGGNWVFLRDNVIQYGIDSSGARHPRTAIALNSTYVFFLVCDGRTSISIGMTIDELAEFCKNTLGATWGVNQDGGGSSTMWVNGTVMNNPSDGSPRSVANGMMICNVAAKAVSTAFDADDTVTTNATASVRYGPGTNYAVITTVAASTQGTIEDHALMGVYAKGYYWWKVDFGSTVGWVAETLLSGSSCTAPSITQHPSNQSVASGGTANFSVTASGTTPLSYQWQKNSVNVTNGGHYSGCTTATLTISNADTNDEAYYRCVVTNSCGNATSNQATLTISAPVSTFIVESRSGGQNYANYSESGSWYNSSAKSTATGCTSGIGSRYAIIGSSAGKGIFSYTPSATGTYEIYTTNCNTTNSGNPLIHRVYHSGGSSTVGVCQNSTCGTNAVNKWLSLGQYNLNGSTTYTVELDASTGAGSAPSGYAARSDSIKWEYLGGGGCTAPAITQHPSNQSVSTGGTANFSVTATGTTPLSYQWQKNSSNVTNGGHYSGCTTATLTISNADSNDAANYRCVVTNSCGSATSNQATLTVTTATTIIDDGFDTYANQTELLAVWPAATTSLTLSTSAYYSSPKSLYSASGSPAKSNKQDISEVYGTDSSPLTLQWRFYDPGGTGTAYQWVEIRDYSPSYKQLFQVGVYSGCSTSYYSARVAYSPGNGWVAMTQNGAPARSAGWHLFKAVIKSTTVDFYIDGVLGSANRSYATSEGSVSFEQVRVGSSYTSTSLSAYYDDVLLIKGQ